MTLLVPGLKQLALIESIRILMAKHISTFVSGLSMDTADAGASPDLSD